jgi:hypothetical protein
MLVFQRDGWQIEIENSTWAEILVFLQKCGWKPSVPAYFFLASNYAMNEADAQLLTAAGQIILEEAVRDPMAAYSSIQFEMGKFAEVIEFAAGGAFTISVDS